MGFLDPRPPGFDPEEWRRQPYHERLRWMCQSWVLQGFGAPPAVYVFYVLKIVLYVGVWVLFVTRSSATGGVAEIATWWAEPVAFQKAVLWSLAFEAMGLGAASGPLTGRYVPPFGGVLYFVRPGTTRLPSFPRVPLTGGVRRTLVDVGLYVALLGLLLRALLAAEPTVGMLTPVAVLLPVIGLRDKTIFLAARSEHYWVTVLVFLFPGDLLAGSKTVQLALWWWAATSKLNHHFPNVVAVMVSNSPVLRLRRLRTAMYRDHPEDLRPSRLARWLAHGGTAVEYGFPVLLVLGSGGWLTTVGLAVMLAFHLYITVNVPLGVPIEWNVFFVYSAFVLFGVHAEIGLLSIDAPLLGVLLVTALLVVPAVGNLMPARVSFLPSMRYYAGNWATSLWLFRHGSLDRLDEGLIKSAPLLRDQLRRFYTEPVVDVVLARAQAFRAMHLHGRALNLLVGRAVDDPDAYEVYDGELIAGLALGWNFGDGHLHHEQLLAAIQAQCGFEEGELRCVLAESQPLGGPGHRWRIVDAAAGQLEAGEIAATELLAAQPWGAAVTERPPARGA